MTDATFVRSVQAGIAQITNVIPFVEMGLLLEEKTVTQDLKTSEFVQITVLMLTIIIIVTEETLIPHLIVTQDITIDLGQQLPLLLSSQRSL